MAHNYSIFSLQIGLNADCAGNMIAKISSLGNDKFRQPSEINRISNENKEERAREVTTCHNDVITQNEFETWY